MLDAAAVSVRVVVVAGHVDSSFPAAGAEPPPLRHGRPSRCASARMNYSAIIIIARLLAQWLAWRRTALRTLTSAVVASDDVPVLLLFSAL